jgi:acyl-CoA thioesterase-1
LIRSGTLALLAAMLLAAPVAAAPDGESCAAPHEMTRLRDGLARTATRIERHEKLTIDAIGSSSTAGYGASDPAFNYPSQFAAE